MNLSDELHTAPLPECCRDCQNRERWITAGVERNRCLNGHPMHDGCGWMRPATVSLMREMD